MEIIIVLFLHLMSNLSFSLRGSSKIGTKEETPAASTYQCHISWLIGSYKLSKFWLFRDTVIHILQKYI